ncbi:MAG: phosphate-starvation-inducible PsiE family protein [Thermosynechococcaceae cyanobacterium MS004]|nr:phosphate-starvation-inducible PsiE family protein [Thermosynechococcaceae cyanobacterium MS004]
MQRQLLRVFQKLNQDDFFLNGVHYFEKALAKILSLFMIGVVLASAIDLGLVLFRVIASPPENFLNRILIDIFGFFLNILIALEILENITAYLRKNVIHVELVIVTSIIAVARKIIILDFEKVEGIDVIGLGIAVFALSVSYWIVRNTKPSTD